MSIKKRFVDWAEKTDRRQREKDSILTRPRRNRKYHSHFEGYTEYPQLQANGSTKIVRVYTGSYYKASLSNPVYVLVRVAYILLWALCVFCQFSAALADLGYNYIWYVTVPEALSFPASFLMMIMVFSAAICNRLMVIRQYRRIHRTMPLIALIGACLLLLTALCMLIYIIASSSSQIHGIWWPPVKMLVASVCFFIIWFIEKRTEYEIIDNPNKVMPGGIEIEK